ncbi:MAG: RagB/SusD family nutrient uptake outer membrane protein [Bacteroidales bacterium]|nr:RagB/SusD family nutrient uptake outer membrane protein [Bacteroidales bacterium]
MKRYKIYTTALALTVMGGFTACDLDEYNPTSISLDEKLQTTSGIKGMQALCYQPIYAQLYSVFDYMQVAECGTDIWWCDRNRTNVEQMFYYEGLTPQTGKGWDKSFTQMYASLGQCNTVINACQEYLESHTKDPDGIATILAETYFLRAFYHLQLTTYYGPITLVTESPTDSKTLTPERNTLSEIYSLIVSDLQYAVQHLPLTQTNRARATKKAAQGLLCRAYAQGAGQGLSEDGVSYWQRAKEESEYMINNLEEFGAYLYDDVSDLWADFNNRANLEFLFVAAGQDACDDETLYNSSSSFSNKLFTYCYPNQKNLKTLSLIENEKYDPLYGRTNQSVLAPSEYLLHCFNPAWDQRWEYSFQTAYFGYSMQLEGSKPFNDSRVKWVKKASATGEATMSEYGVTFSDSQEHSIVPYVDMDVVAYTGGGRQYPARVWPKGCTSIDSSMDYDEVEAMLIDVKKIYANPYPLDADDNRFYLYLYPEWDTKNCSNYDRSDRVYCSVQIGSLFMEDETGYRRYISNQNELKANASYISDSTNVYIERPTLNKYMWNYEGVYYGSNLQIRNGDVAIMRTAEVYLIAAEANQQLGNEAKAAEYLNVLRKRAARADAVASDYELATATENDVLDEYARELCGEFQRWAILQRHGALADRLALYNGRAAQSFKPYMTWRPISASFLQQIDNKDAYGDNGYGTTASSGLDGYLE